MGETGNFSACADWKSRRGTGFYQESARAKMENGNSPANVLGLLGLITASLVLPHQGGVSPACDGGFFTERICFAIV